jgi:F-type H+-transporting ATPase subunit delta
MAELATLARPYARAVFELARDSHRFADWSAILTGLADAVRDPKVAAWIGHPSLGRGQLADLLIEAFGGRLDVQGQNLLRLLAEYHRVSLVPAIAAEFEALRAEAEKRVDVEIVTASTVDDAQKSTLADAVQRKLGRAVDVSWSIDESLLGGARIRAGDLIIDASVAGELEHLRHALIAA